MTTTDLEPAAWMYTPINMIRVNGGPVAQTNRANMNQKYWTETALYTADQLQALIEERDRLRGALAALIRDWEQTDASDNDEWSDGYEDALADVARKARAALAGEKP